MGPLKIIVIGVLIISTITFVALFGRLPALRKGPVGVLHRLIWNNLPVALYRLDNFVTGGQITSSIRRFGYYLMNENHPLILIFFLLLLLGSQLLFVPSSFARLPAFHRVLVVTLCIIPHIFIYKTVTSTASYVTSANHSYWMQQYPYDYVLFQPGKICPTCQFPKPARSKHCSICKACIAKHDHHCIWVMNCLGKANYAYFIGMLFSIAILLSYGGYLTHMILTETLQRRADQRPQGIQSKLHWSFGKSWSQYFESWAWALSRDVSIGGVGMLAVMTAPLAWGLFLYHIHLIRVGMTTNERSKWEDWRDDIADGLVFKSERRLDDHINGQPDLGTEPLVEWPISTSQWLVRCEDGQPPDIPLASCENGERLPSAGNPSHSSPWKRLQDLHDVDNLYNLGFWDNIADAMTV